MTAPITCRYAGIKAAACGAFDTEHHARAGAAGVCCVTLAFADVSDHQDVSAPTGPDWPPFSPTDDDVPEGQ
jgi:hypothetical protein